jgi:hypothetical protein
MFARIDEVFAYSHHVLSSIVTNLDDSSVASDTSSQTSTPAIVYTPTRSRLSFRRKKREEVVMNSLTYDQKLCALCCYAPLYSNGFIFPRELACRLCQNAFGSDVQRWQEAFNGLVAVGWLQRHGSML